MREPSERTRRKTRQEYPEAIGAEQEDPEVSAPVPLEDPSSGELQPEQEPTSPLEQADTIAAQPDAEVRYADIEILGNRYPVRQMVHEFGNQRMKAIEGVRATWKNTLDTPGKLRLRLSQTLAESRYNRHKAKLDAVQEFGSDRLKQRRVAKLAKAEVRFDAAKKAYGGRQERMQQRITTVEENSTKRREEYIAELKGRKEAALARRSVRHELRNQGASWSEVRSIVKDIPKEHLDRVGRLAGVAALSERYAAKASKVEGKSSHKEVKVNRDIATNRRRAEMYASEASKADATIDRIRTTSLPAAESNLEAIRSELNSLADDDPAWEGLAAQVSEAEHQVALYTDREIPYWKYVAEDNRKHIVALTSEHTALQDELVKHKKSSAAHSEISTEKQETAKQDVADQRASINDALSLPDDH